jgi:type VI secretion system secreted protein VgrG
MRYAIEKQDGGRMEGVTDEEGMLTLQQGFSPEKIFIKILGRVGK